jgi:peptidyl-prolyl cis-trans isomerase SurA
MMRPHGATGGASSKPLLAWFPLPPAGDNRVRGVHLAIPIVFFRRLATAGCLVAATATLSGCESGGLGDLFGGKAKAPTVPVTDTISKPDIPTLKGNSSIAVLVNEDPITNYDISQRVKLMQLGGAKATTKTATDELIDETLQLYEAKKRGFKAPEDQISEAYASIAQNMKITPPQLTQALGSRGIDSDTLKARLRAQLTWQYLVQRRTQQKAQVKAEDVTTALLAKGDPGAMTLNEFILQQIVFVVPSGSPQTLYAQRRREAEAFRQRFAGCDQSLAQAKQLRGVVVKDIGRRDATQLNGEEGQNIQKTPAGKTAPPEQTELGIELIAVCSVKQVQSTAAARAEVTNALYLKQSKDLGKDYMDELRKAAIIEYR